MFLKHAKVPIIAIAEAKLESGSDALSFKLTAGRKDASYYQANAGRIDVGGMLKLVAENYDISANPHDYIFEAARAVTAEVPNENGDGFPRNELLRFDHRLGKAVYQTFILKPHHINHRADNPKTSRGVVLDASYNDMAPPLNNCPDCGTKTAGVEGRDAATGIHCIKCGSVVKDEFVELLLAIDTKKDPTFAEGVRTGSLDSLSMGCEASYTDCSICDNRARSVSEFCSHIKSGKKKRFKTASGMRMSFEKCGGVIFTEISRVDQPADPTAKQRELFSYPMSTESDMLIMSTRLAKVENLLRVAQAVQSPPVAPKPKVPSPIEPPGPPGAEPQPEDMASMPKQPQSKQPNQSYDGDPAKAPAGDPNLSDEVGDEVTDPTRHETMESLHQLITELSQNAVGSPDLNTQKELSVWQKALSLLEDMDRADQNEHGGPSALNPAANPVEPPAGPNTPGLEAYVAQVEISPQVPFKTLAESIKWAESSVYKLKAENHRLASERELRSRDAAASGRPFLAWENASYTAQIKTNGQYIERLGKYVAKARELEASGAPWGKDLTRSMSRFFATKIGQQALDEVMDSLDEVEQSNPQMVEMIKMTLQPDGGVAGGSGLNDYLQKREDSQDQHVTNEEMGIRPEEQGGPKLPGAMAGRKAVEDSIASDINDIMGSVKENQVATSKELKFAGIYKDVQVSVTKVGNVRVSTSAGNLFIVRPAIKPQDKAGAKRIAHEVLAHIAEFGLTETVLKYDAVLGPKMAQVLEHHIEDFDGGREDGDKGPITDDHETDMDFKMDKPKDSLVEKEHTDRADEVREQRDQSNADVLEDHLPDHKDGLPAGIKPITDSEDSDMDHKRNKPSKSILKDIEVDHKDLKPKKSAKAAEWEKPWLKDEEKDGEEKDEGKSEKKEKKDAQMQPPGAMPAAPGSTGPTPAPSAAPPASPPAGPGVMSASPGAMCAAGAMCADVMCPEHGKAAQDGMTPGGAPPGGPSAMPMGASMDKAAAQKHQTRVERLYKTRLEKVTADNAKKLAEVDKTAVNKALAKLARAMKLAAKRQELNIEYSPLKAAMHDVLANELDLDADTIYPGMDDFTASKLVESTASTAFTDFTNSLIKRATEFLAMSDEALSAIESDVKNLQPVGINVQASAQPKQPVRQTLKKAAIDGNFVAKSASSDETISNGSKWDNIRSALNTTKVQRTSQALLKK